MIFTELNRALFSEDSENAMFVFVEYNYIVSDQIANSSLRKLFTRRVTRHDTGIVYDIDTGIGCPSNSILINHEPI